MLNEEDRIKRYEIINLIENQLHEIWKECDIILYGSFHQGLSWKGSDVDLCVETKNENPPTWNEIDQFREIMENSQMKTKFIGTAKIPLIILYHAKDNLKIDVTFSYYNRSCFQDSITIQSFVAQHEESFKVIVIFIKYLLSTYGFDNQSNICKTVLSSYQLVQMTIYFFHHKCNFAKEQKKNHNSIMDDFLKFLYFYGYLFTNDQNIYTEEMENVLTPNYQMIPFFRYVYSCFNELKNK